jgi:hypothetical protein
VDWLERHGFTNAYEAAEMTDPDEDDMWTWEEFVAGTDPTNGTSRLVLHASANAGAEWVELSFAATSQRVYRVDGCTDLQTGSWVRVVSNLQVEGRGVLVTNLPVAVPARFYRLGVSR